MRKAIRNYYPVFIYGFLWLVMQYFMRAWVGDEYTYANLLNEQTVFQVITDYYQHWSSRIIWDSLCAVIHHYPLVYFKILNSIILAIQCYGIIRFTKMEQIKEQLTVIGLISCFNYLCFFDCGFSVTSVYYIWPMTAAIWSLYLLDRYLYENKKIGIVILDIFLTLMADNMEQILVVVILCQLFYFIKMLIEKKLSLTSIAGLVTSFASILFTITTPGKRIRFHSEVINSFSEYGMLSLLEKMDMGFSTTIKKMALSGSPIWLLVTFFIFILSLEKKEQWEQVMCSIPFFIELIYGPLIYVAGEVFPDITSVGELNNYGIIDLTVFDAPRKWVPLFFMVFFFSSLLISIWICFDNKEKGWLMIVLCIAGLLSRVAMGFSPTIYNSGDRTTYPMWMAGILTACILAKELSVKKGKIVLYTSCFMGIMETYMFLLHIR